MAGRSHDYPEHFAAGFEPHAVTEKYYYARRPEITRVVDISGTIEKKVDANVCNVAKGPADITVRDCGPSWRSRAEQLPLLGDDDERPTATTSRNSACAEPRIGSQYGVEYAEAFHYLAAGSAGAGTDPTVEDYVKQHAVPLK